MEETPKSYLISLPIVALLVGLVGGYFYGVKVGTEKGRADLLLEQQKLQEEETARVIEEVQSAANPFSEEEQVVNPFEQGETVNPFESGYTNPFSR